MSMAATGEDPRRVALVEDDTRTRKAMHKLLEMSGFRVVPFTSADAALGDLQAEPFHGLVTDHVMPGMTGLELVLRLRALRPTLRSVVISGVDRPEQAAQAGIPWLSKPVDLGALLSVLE